ncbi:MAG: transcription antitermination factor NusB [Actinomycetota bacterium]|nr:transcription antitermination factor NusB [Actinomycetota bacterium]
MLPRTKARKRALDILHAADVTATSPLEIVSLEDEPIQPFAREIIIGVVEHLADIDALIREYADRWPLERMPVVDRNLLRIALFEILFGTDTPPGVAINEAVDLAKMLSTEDSGRFINGLLGRVARERGIGAR